MLYFKQVARSANVEDRTVEELHPDFLVFFNHNQIGRSLGTIHFNWKYMQYEFHPEIGIQLPVSHLLEVANKVQSLTQHNLAWEIKTKLRKLDEQKIKVE